MKLAYRIIIVFAVLMSSQVNAAIITNPVPGVYGEDTQDNGYFTVTGNSFLTEILDITTEMYLAFTFKEVTLVTPVIYTLYSTNLMRNLIKL
jgi:hypothetical protein